jgi:chromosome segregation ATPase
MDEKPALKRMAAAGLAAALAACASMPPPQAQLAAARAMVSQAQAAAAREAPVELSVAQAKLARAEQAMKRDDYVNARIYAEQAEVDAKYAWTLAENARAQRAAAEVGKSINALRQELQRRSQ